MWGRKVYIVYNVFGVKCKELLNCITVSPALPTLSPASDILVTVDIVF